MHTGDCAGGNGAPSANDDGARSANLLGAAALEAAGALEAATRPVVGQAGAAAAALVTIAAHPGRSIEALRAPVGLSQPGAVRLVERLVGLGWVDRSGPGGRRGLELRLTPDGEAVLQEMLLARRAALAELLEPLAPREREQLSALLEKLLAARTGHRPDLERLCRLCEWRICDECPVAGALRREETRRPALSEANRAALAAVRTRAEGDRPRLMARIETVLAAAGVEADPELLLAAAAGAGDLTLNFHPDRLLADGRSVAEALHEDGAYRCQFETGISSGALTAYPGGGRDAWERALFAGAYQAAGVQAAERPKYGGLNLMNFPDGACPGFGSCHLRLRRAAAGRATFIFGDSSANPTDIAVADAFAPVMAPLLESIAAGGGALGRGGVDVRAFADGLLRGDSAERRGAFAPAMERRTLNDYVEAQVHGAVSLAADVDAIVIDPAFAGTPAGDLLLAAAERHGFEAEWHPGRALPLSRVPRDAPEAAGTEPMRWQLFCAGGRARRLADRVIEHAGTAAHLDAANIGQAAAGVVRDPERWRDWGAPLEVLRHLKDLWVIVVAHGEPPPAPDRHGSA